MEAQKDNYRRRKRSTGPERQVQATDRQVKAQKDKHRHRRQVQAQKTLRYRQTSTVTKRTERQELVFYAKAQTERALSFCLLYFL